MIPSAEILHGYGRRRVAQLRKSRNNSVEAGLGVVVKSAPICLGRLHRFISEMREEHYCFRSASSVRTLLLVAKAPQRLALYHEASAPDKLALIKDHVHDMATAEAEEATSTPAGGAAGATG
jgi:hypothetical protein